MINVLVADNQTLTREGIGNILANIVDIRVVGYSSNMNELENNIIRFKPEVLIIDHGYSSRFTTFDIQKIKDRFNSIRFLVLSNRQARNKIIEIVNLGIKNFIFKECSREELVHAIYNTARGEQFYCKNTFETLFGNKLIPEKTDDANQLSSRELEIIHLIAEGMTNPEIAEKLFLSIHTIKTHRKNMIKKLGFTFKNAAEVAAFIHSTEFI
jgi:DNA-binding NarL/FixJ family response regulator